MRENVRVEKKATSNAAFGAIIIPNTLHKSHTEDEYIKHCDADRRKHTKLTSLRSNYSIAKRIECQLIILSLYGKSRCRYIVKL